MSSRLSTGTRQRFTKSEILETIATDTGLSKKHIQAVLDSLANIIYRHLKPRAVGEFVLPGLLKIKRIKKPARPARKGVPNPFRPGETMDVAAKPASVAVKVQPLANLKKMLSG